MSVVNVLVAGMPEKFQSITTACGELMRSVMVFVWPFLGVGAV
jgi:hypothetical protein